MERVCHIERCHLLILSVEDISTGISAACDADGVENTSNEKGNNAMVLISMSCVTSFFLAAEIASAFNCVYGVCVRVCV